MARIIMDADSTYDADYYFRVDPGWIGQELEGHRWIFNWGSSTSTGVWRNDGAIVTEFELTETTFTLEEKFFGPVFTMTDLADGIYIQARNALRDGNEELAWKKLLSKRDFFDGSSEEGGAGFSHHFLGYNGKDRILGGDRADTLDGGKGNDRIIGNDGVDFITGGRGKDKLTGDSLDGSDELRDYFIYSSAKDSKLGKKTSDVITDFSHSDSIRLDFDFATDSDAQFEFLALVDQFTGVGGQVRYHKGYVKLDRNGDGKGDFGIKIGKDKQISVQLNQIFGFDAPESAPAPEPIEVTAPDDLGLDSLPGDIWG
ncbi:MAG: hypothetical protein Alpg2KO_07350 [Alphaproteobacteria bacterium]